MEFIVIGLLLAFGTGLSALIGASTAHIQNLKRKIQEGSGTLNDHDEVKMLRKARAWAGAGVVMSLVSFVAMLAVN